MPKTKEQKKDALAEVKSKFDESKLVILTSYQELPVSASEELRKNLREKDAFYRVVKKTILKIAQEGNIDNDLMNEIKGNISLAYSPDEVSAAKILAEFAKDHEGLNIEGGWLEGEFISKAKVEELSKLLSKEELLAKLVGTLKSPISGFVNVLEGNTRGLVNVLKAIADLKN